MRTLTNMAEGREQSEWNRWRPLLSFLTGEDLSPFKVERSKPSGHRKAGGFRPRSEAELKSWLGER